MKVYVVDNGGQWTHREWRVLKYLDVDTEIIPNTTPLEELDVDGLVLSGGAGSTVGDSVPGKIDDYLEKASFPILGICFGHHYLSLHFGGKTGVAEAPEFGRMEIVVDKENELFSGLPKTFNAWLSHNDEVKELSDDFTVLAHSANCRIEAIKYLKKPFYGVQFHPEVEHTEHGYEIFKNFLNLCKK
ncbi:MAG: GMP synthase subunit A [Methanomassiliicoccales archaeon]|nr:MAG: GMP synthase subunit A [Methanomassiliicoccales archaeon]